MHTYEENWENFCFISKCIYYLPWDDYTLIWLLLWMHQMSAQIQGFLGWQLFDLISNKVLRFGIERMFSVVPKRCSLLCIPLCKCHRHRMYRLNTHHNKINCRWYYSLWFDWKIFIKSFKKPFLNSSIYICGQCSKTTYIMKNRLVLLWPVKNLLMIFWCCIGGALSWHI